MSNEDLSKFREWVAGRKTAAATIDIQTCDYFWRHVQLFDPYGLHQDAAFKASE